LKGNIRLSDVSIEKSPWEIILGEVPQEKGIEKGLRS
jgi:hypothetical protein